MPPKPKPPPPAGDSPDRRRRAFLKAAGICGALGAAAAYPVFLERHAVITNRYRIPVPNLPRAFEGFRIVHLTDIHYGFLVPKLAVERVVAKANKLEPDLIVCTGDFVHERNTTAEIDGVWPILENLRARCGVGSVAGNHDHWADTERTAYWLERTGQDLRNRVRTIRRDGERIHVAGIGDLWEDATSPDEALARVPEDECRIVIAHNPDAADTGFTTRVDLMLCGHTHGGQVRIPFLGAPVLPVRNKTYSSGLKRSPAGTPVFISRGIGWAIYPVRFNCPPEIAVLELTREPPDRTA